VVELEKDSVIKIKLLEAKKKVEAKLKLVAIDNLDAKIIVIEVEAGVNLKVCAFSSVCVWQGRSKVH
jgi:hypothetical protein